MDDEMKKRVEAYALAVRPVQEVPGRFRDAQR